MDFIGEVKTESRARVASTYRRAFRISGPSPADSIKIHQELRSSPSLRCGYVISKHVNFLDLRDKLNSNPMMWSVNATTILKGLGDMAFQKSSSLVVVMTCLLFSASSYANFVPKTSLCSKMTIANCAAAVKHAISSSTSPEQAVEAWGAWAEAYEKAYRGMANAPVPPSDLDRIEDKIADKVGDYTDPASIAKNLAIKRFFPMLASVMEFAEGPVVLLVTGIISPSPMQTPAQELRATNDELGRLLLTKTPILLPNWKTRYSTVVQDAFEGPTIQKP
jgi:hypothetical protein